MFRHGKFGRRYGVNIQRRSTEWEYYERREDQRKIAQAIKESQQRAEIVESWGKAMLVQRFFNDVEDRLMEEQRQFLEWRVKLARQMIGSISPLEFLTKLVRTGDRYQSKYDERPRPPAGGRSDEQ